MSHALADHVGIQADFDFERLVVIRAVLADQHIFHLFLRVLLYHFLELGLVIVETGGLLFLLFRIIRDKPQDMPLCRIHAAVQENGSDHCLKGICQNGRTGSAAGMLFALAQQQKFAQVDLLGENVQRLFTDHRCPELGQLALRQFRILVKQELGNHDGQHAVSQEFQALVALACLALFVGIR